MKAMTFEATLRSGAKVQFKATSVKLTGQSMTWEQPNDVVPRLMKLDFDEIAALVRVA